ncbi:methylenetetrahydrofolate reductase [NAD(P)H] [Beggiatoa leptomitoformis]|uniref:Methylenetetrahydrofolate reductase n=1 Tax=Beggiatoa leptomitoformis TaxID=288004 RepID=A0A2N9YA67_9GAMM|nr:methylenetetrahydrofolate reductase [NAD(P)H] [Beggiatoa leptomitoformis]ALG67236.1 methylenetetrahydrofolate reductase [NAD(P)H] [Beggiatoa leptomitoformis]AUI67345.1 methylenetetrahydrofolate reductase [NAD(P)H] [Beggiatoa leptomitoformis]
MTAINTLTVSCEFFPPRTEDGIIKLRQVQERLKALNPAYYSVTFGAGGSTQEKTYETVVDIQIQSNIPAAPHLSCIGSTRDNIRQLLQAYQAKNINRIVALRGDQPSGWAGRLGDFNYANELVEFIRAETGDYFHIEVAAYPEVHPQSKTPQADLNYFAQKVRAGANSAITQYFYNVDAYLYFVDACQKQGIDIPIIPGIMPISNYEQLSRFSDICGAEIPRWLRKRLEPMHEDKTALQAFGVDVVTHLCQQLINNGVSGLHFYALNQSDLTLRIANNLGLVT